MHRELFETLKKDHREVKDLLEKLTGTSDNAVSERERLFVKLIQELKPHMKAEEKILYPALLESEEGRSSTLESLEEHHVAEFVLKELGSTHKSEERWGAKMMVFKEIVEHHIKEEEKEVFKAAKSFFSDDELQDIFERFNAEKAKVKSTLK